MNDEALQELKELCRYNRCPAQTTLRKIEDYILAQNRASWRTNRSTLQAVTKQVLEMLGIADKVVVSFRNVPGFLLNPAKVITVYLNKEKTKFNLHHVDELNEYGFSESVVKDGDEYYSIECQTSWWELASPTALNGVTSANARLWKNYFRSKQGLSWKAPVLETCRECQRQHLKSEMVYNERIEGFVDPLCNVVINSFVNSQQNPATPITSYHSHKLTWKFYPQRLGKERTIPMGVELEMQNKYGASPEYANQAAAQILMTLTDSNPQYYFETDSSLSAGGFEMIANPMTLEFATNWWSRALPIIRKHCVGYGVEKYLGREESESLNYGIHITVPRSYVPDSVITKIARFFDARDNYAFMGAIAQRQAIYGGYNLGVHSVPKASTSLSWNKEVKGSMASKDRRQPINIKGNLIEFRMFRSTLNQVSFLKNLEFIDAITSYYKEALGRSHHHKDFIVWLSKNCKRYPNLIKYLQHPVFFVKGIGAVKSTWLPLVQEIKFKVYDPYKEYGPAPLYLDNVDQQESSMVGA